MQCKEAGLLPQSQYFFFTQNPYYSKHFYYITVCGHFFANKDYKIERAGGVSPLLFYILDGELTLFCGNEKHTARKNQIVLLDCSKEHKYFTTSSCEFLFFHFDGAESYELTKQLNNSNQNIVFNLKNPKLLLEELQAFIKNLEEDCSVSDLTASCLVYKALSLLQMENKNSFQVKKSEKLFFTKAVNYIRENIYEQITLDDLADAAAISKFHFSRLFKEETGLAPLEYVVQTKINLAKTILSTTNRTIADIAMDLGFSSESSFINAFKKRTGISPNRFRLRQS